MQQYPATSGSASSTTSAIAAGSAASPDALTRYRNVGAPTGANHTWEHSK